MKAHPDNILASPPTEYVVLYDPKTDCVSMLYKRGSVYYYTADLGTEDTGIPAHCSPAHWIRPSSPFSHREIIEQL